MRLEEWQQLQTELERRHGPIVGVTPRNPTLSDPVLGLMPNPQPTYRYVFADNSYVDVLGSGGPGGTDPSTTYEIAGGSALEDDQKTEGKKTPKGTTRLVRENQNGRLYQVQEIADGFGGWSIDPTYTPQVLIDKETAAPSAGTAGRTRFPEEVDLDVARTERERASTATEAAQRGYYEEQTRKLQRENAPKYQQAIKDYYDSVATIQGMLEQGKMKPEEADAYMASFKANMESAMRGATPFEEKKQRETEARERAGIGKDILNQRLASGTGLANTLVNSFTQNLDTLGWGLAPGQTVPFNPFNLAEDFTNRMGGGTETADLARSLLQGINPGGPGQPASQAAPSPTGGTGGPVNLRLAYEMARQADMAAMGSQGGQ